MNYSTRTIVAAALVALFIPGCAVYRVRVNAFLSNELPFPTSARQPAAVVAVVVGSEPKEPLLEAEVARKVKHLLRDRGYRLGDEAQASHVLTCWISIDRGVTDTVSDYRDCYPGTSTSFVYTYHGRWHGGGVTSPGVVYGDHYAYTYYTRFLGLTLYERERWVSASEDDVGEAAVWTCTAVSTGSSSDLRSAVNFLLAAAFDRFGVDTGREVRDLIGRNDPRVTDIVESGALDR